MSPTPQPGNVGGAMYPTSVGANGPVYPYSLDVANGGMDITVATRTTTDATHTFTSVFSGVLTSVPSDHTIGFSQQYGYFEISMKAPAVVGGWPAFWMLSQSNNMEIDIIEQYGGNGHNPAHYFATSHDYANNVLNGPYEIGGTGIDLSSAYHLYSVLWDATQISFYFDRVKQITFTTPTGANQPMYVLVDMGTGGGWPTCVATVQTCPTPPAGYSATLAGAVMGVQSINVWQHN